jgi:hypothetical protein
MDSNRFDALARSVSTLVSRRKLAGGLGLSALMLPGLGEAKKKHKHKKKKKVKFNDFGCVNVGNFCKNSEQCCSGICQGKKDKKKCQAHDASTCQAGQTVVACGGSGNVTCTTSSGDPGGSCLTTTGHGALCAHFATCFVCTKDADCQAPCGPQAACIVCPACAAAPGNAGTLCAAGDGSTCAP